MKMNVRLMSVLTLALLLTFTACKKDSKSEDNSQQLTAHADDQRQVSDQIDNATADASAALESSPFLAGRMQNPPLNLCNASAVFDTVSNPRTITITYNGNDCRGTHYRTGVIVLSMPAGVRWRDAGASVTATYQNFKVKRLSDNKSITINGAHLLTNVSGGLLYELATQSPVIHTISSNNMNIKFDDNTQRTWQVARKRTYTYNNGAVLTISGNYTSGNNNQIAEWGTDRFGRSFTTSITQPLVIRQDCNFRLAAGEVKHESVGTATVTFGLNASGQPASCPGTGNYYFKIVWTGPNGGSLSAIWPY